MSTQNTDQAKSASQIVAEARKTIPEITAAQAKEELDQEQVGLLLDVREPSEWDKGHIPGAVLAPRGMLEWYADPTTPYAKPELTTKRDARIIVQCASGGRSMLAAETLVISYRTVETHIANIMYKLSYTSRSQVAAWVVEKGLMNPPM